MKKRFLRNTLISATVHILIISALFGISFISLYRIRHSHQELITFIKIAPLIDSSQSSVSTGDKIPEPPKKPRKTQPSKKKKPIQVSNKLVKRSSIESSHKLTRKDIRKMLGKSISLNKINSFEDPLAWYLSRVRSIMYKAWKQPGTLSGESGLVTSVMIRVQRNGKITERKMIQSSGNILMDTSVMNAVKSVDRIQELPAELANPYHDITVDFELAETSTVSGK